MGLDKRVWLPPIIIENELLSICPVLCVAPPLGSDHYCATPLGLSDINPLPGVVGRLLRPPTPGYKILPRWGNFDLKKPGPQIDYFQW